MAKKKKSQKIDISYPSENVALGTEMTGSIPTPLETDEELISYSQLVGGINPDTSNHSER